MDREGQLHTYYYFIDAQGDWFCEDNRITDPNLLRLLSRSLSFDGQGHWVRCQGETHPVVVADAPLTVTGLDLENSGPRLSRAVLTLNDGRTVPLTGPLWTGTGNALYTRVDPSNLKARFNRRTFYELTAFLQEENGGYFIELDGQRLEIG